MVEVVTQIVCLTHNSIYNNSLSEKIWKLYLLRGEDFKKEMACEALGIDIDPANAFKLLSPLKRDIETVGLRLITTKARVPGKGESHHLPYKDPSIYEFESSQKQLIHVKIKYA